MNSVKNNVSFYQSYFHGIQDILELKSIKQAAIGACKILSGFTMVTPIFFALGYHFERNKLSKLENLCGRVSIALQSQDENKNLTQNELITFLTTRVLDKNYRDGLFEAAFDRLDGTAQGQFFACMADKGLLIDSLVHVPKNIREINGSFGSSPFRDMVDKTIAQLCLKKTQKNLSREIL